MSEHVNDQPQRAEALRDLVQLRRPVGPAITALAGFVWDSVEELVILTRADALRLLARYRTQQLTAKDCRRWAETLEGRDDLGLEAGYEDALKDFLFTIATPELTEPLTPQLTQRWEAALTFTGGD
jgi:hypothetical protein